MKIEMKTVTNGGTERVPNTGLPERQYSLEDVLSDLKISGRYHIRFLCLISFLLMINAGYSINYVFSAESVDYKCKYTECNQTELNNIEVDSTLDFKCHKYDVYNENGTCTKDDFNLSNFTVCSDWDYEKPNSFVAQFNLGCQDWKRTLVGTMHSIGFMIGLLFIGPLSDKFGRKKVLIFNNIFAGVIGISKSMVHTYWLFIVLETLEPMLGDNFSTVYTTALEMMTKDNRPIIVLILSISITFGEIIMAFIAYSAPSWRIFLMSIYAPAFLSILYLFVLDESPRWLLIKGKKEKVEVMLRNAAKMNRITIDESKIANLRIEDNPSTSWWTSLNVTFSSRKLFVRFILCICIWFSSLFNAYSLSINSVSLEGDKYINFGLVTLADTAAGFILLFVLTKFKRKGPLVFAMTLTGIFCVSQSFVPTGYRWLSTLLYACGKINASITMQMTYLYTSELFPTYTRNTMLALCSALGRIGTILAPLTPLLLVYWSGLPSLLVGSLSLLTASIVTFMPDTSEEELPDNVKQAEAIGSK